MRAATRNKGNLIGNSIIFPDSKITFTITTTGFRAADVMKWEIEHAVQAFDLRAASWQRIVNESYSATPGLSAIFVRQLIRHYADAYTFLATAIDDDRVRAHILLKKTGTGRWTTFNPPQVVLGLAVFADCDHSDESLLTSLASALPGPCLQLKIMKQDPDLTHWSNTDPRIDLILRNTTITVDVTGDFDAYWSGRKKKLRNNISRYTKRLNELGHNLSIEVLTSPNDMIRGVTEHGLLESKGWKGRQGTAIHPKSKDGRFYQDLFRDFAAQAKAKIYRLNLDGRTIASRMLVFDQDIMMSLKIAHDESFSKYAPGRVLLYHFLKQEFEAQDSKTIEFYTQANNDQIQWTSHTKTMFQVVIYPHPIYRRGFNYLRSIKQSLLAIRKGGGDKALAPSRISDE